MPNNINNVSFQAPSNPYAIELQEIERRRQLAQALQEQGAAPLGNTETIGGWAIPKSPMEGLAKALQQGLGAYQQKKAGDDEKAVATKYNEDLVRVLTQGSQLSAGTPARFQQPDPQEFEQAADQGGESPAGFNVPAKPGDPMAAASLYMTHPATQALGMQQMQKQADAQEFKNLVQQLRSGASGGAPGGMPTGAAGGAAQGDMPTNADPFANIDPSALALTGSSNPHAAGLAKMLQTAYDEQHKPQNLRSESTVYIPGRGAVFTAPKGGVQTTWNNGMPSMSAVQGANDVLGAQAGAVAGGTEAGKAPYLLDTVNTPGAPTLMTRQQQIEAATGRPMPQPGAQTTPLQPQPNIPAQPLGIPASSVVGHNPALAGRPPAEQNAIRTVMDAESRGQPASVSVPGLKLQDQGDSAKQKKVGELSAELQFDAPKARAAVSDAVTNLDRLATQAKQIYENPALWRITGIPGKFPNIPGLAGADVQANLGSLKSQVGFAVLQAMRDASKTGGALGQISDRENELLQRNLAALDNSQSPEAFRDNLAKVIEYAQGARDRMQNAYRDQYERVQGNQGMTPTPRGAMPAGTQPARTQAPRSGPPPGVDPKLWQHMTPQEKALWK